MGTTVLNGTDLKRLLSGGLNNLILNKKIIDNLNVFPVPDGDTGSNMLMTIEGGINAVADKEITDSGEFMKAFARGAFFGARGNSGVILSQFIKGLSSGMEGKSSVNAEDFIGAFSQGVDCAYRAVIDPTEGTMLTVMREGYENTSSAGKTYEDMESLLAELIKNMEVSLDHTPELLPILKKSGVVDSGGAGLLCIFKGMDMALKGEISDTVMEGLGENTAETEEEEEFGYCTEFILTLDNEKPEGAHFELGTMIGFLEKAGNSIVAVRDEDTVKVHIHTFRPGDVLNYCQQFGEFYTIKIENMTVQHSETRMAAVNTTRGRRKRIAVAAVASGSGMEQYFYELGADICIAGGQTENPSVQDFIDAFDRLNAEHIIVLPGNSNILMSASNAAESYKECEVHVVESVTAAENYAVLSMMDKDKADIQDILDDMKYACANVESGAVTTATRDVTYDHITVTKGHYIGFNKDIILSDAEKAVDAFVDLLKNTEDIKDKEVLTVFYGKEALREDMETLSEILDKEFSWLEYGFIEGGHPVYDYILALE
ncbi:MAG: DAK2 domain-containing protein [Parasporobacterium sp.]|nr:DAK2 domain-containing protein [Parasporobacterium sp.]